MDPSPAARSPRPRRSSPRPSRTAATPSGVPPRRWSTWQTLRRYHALIAINTQLPHAELQAGRVAEDDVEAALVATVLGAIARNAT
jgi:hypothetical protein